MAKKYIQKALSVGLSLALCASLAAPAFAASFSELNEAINSTDDRTFGENGDIMASTDENGVRNVVLSGNVTNSGNESSITIDSGKNVNLDLNGNTINANGMSGSAIWVKDSGELTLEDSGSNGQITGAHGSGIWVDGTFTMNDGAITGNSADNSAGGAHAHGGGVHVDGGTFTMTGGEISGNTANKQGGGVYVNDGTFTMTGGEISGNNAKWGGAVNSYNGEVNVEGGTISGNTGDNGGDAIWSKADGSNKTANVNVSGGEIGGDVVVESAGNGMSGLNISGGSISGNEGYDVMLKGNGSSVDATGLDGFDKFTDENGEDIEGLRIVNEGGDQKLDLVMSEPAPEVPGDDTATVEIADQAIPLSSGPITRAQFIDYLWRHEGEPESAGVCTFTDVTEDHEYFDALCWADENGVAVAYFGVEGHEDGTFEPDELVTVAAVREFLGNFETVFGAQAVAAADLTTLTGADDEAVLNCGEVLAEFFGEEYAPAQEEDIEVAA